jgi:hypothetical protein
LPKSCLARPDPEADQLAVDAAIAQIGFSRTNRKTRSQIPRSVLGPPTLCRQYVQRRATSLRCQRKSVAGETKNDDHAALGSQRLTRPAATCRSAATAAE